MKMQKVMILVVIVLIFTGCNSGNDDKSVCSFAPTGESTKENAVEVTDPTGAKTGQVTGDAEAAEESTETGRIMYVNTYADVRGVPMMEGDIIGILKPCEAVKVIEDMGSEWYRIDYGNEEEAYVNARLLQEEKPAIQEPETEAQENMDLCVGLAKEIFEQTNAEREAAGVEPLIWDDELAEYAGIRAEEIITNFSHIRDDGTKCYALSELIWGENIARGPHANGKEFLEHWMASEGHKANILNPEYTTIGVGITCTEQGDTAVQLFGVN